jgi:hypothetical protein
MHAPVVAYRKRSFTVAGDGRRIRQAFSERGAFSVTTVLNSSKRLLGISQPGIQALFTKPISSFDAHATPTCGMWVKDGASVRRHSRLQAHRGLLDKAFAFP